MFYISICTSNLQNEDSDMMLEDVTGKIVPAIDVFALSIKALVNHLMYTLTQGTGVTLDDIQWVLTVPAIWTDNLMQFMRTSSEKVCIYFRKIITEY